MIGTNMSRATRRKEATAYHEAGHAVAYHWLREHYPLPRIRRATIVSSGDVAGEVAVFYTPAAVARIGRIDDVDDLSLRDRRRLEGEIMVDLAGAIAENRHTGRSTRPRGSAEDYHHAVKCAGILSGSDREVSALLTWLAVRTEDLIAHRWWAVEAVAAALLQHGTLTGRQVAAAIQNHRRA